MQITMIKLERIKKGINQKELAKRINYSFDMLYKVETRKYKPSLEMLFELCDELDLSIVEVCKDLEIDFGKYEPIIKRAYEELTK